MTVEQTVPSVRLVIDPEAVAEARLALLSPAAGLPIEPWLDSTGAEYGYCCGDGDGFYAYIHEVGGFLFDRTSPVVRGAPESVDADAAFYDIFCNDIVPVVFQHHRWEVLHACGLEVAGACVALSGKSKSGKSTLAYAWRRRGGQVFADDAIPFRADAGRITVCTIPFRIRLRHPSSRHFASLDGETADPKAVQYEARMPSLPLAAVFMLERRPEQDGGVRIERLPPDQALAGLFSQAYYLTKKDPARNRRMVESYLSLADLAPTFRLSYPTGLERTDAILNHLVAWVAELRKVGPSGR
jgi:hypothetical protein